MPTNDGHATIAATAARPTTSLPGRRSSARIPGEPEFWVFLGGDLLLFAALIVVWCVEAHDQSAEFVRGQTSLHVIVGLAMTVSLLTSSWLVAGAAAAARASDPSRARRFFAGAIGLGLAFVALKVYEYVDLALGGINVQASGFDMYYFTVTGIHLLHVVVGLTVLVAIRRGVGRTPEQGAMGRQFIEGGATYWHIVDVVWIFLFILIYIM